MIRGLVFDIQHFSVHDGPGIRTTVFMKGCQLRCPWCHNPESIAPEPQILRYPEKCIGCGRCDEGCFSGARVVCGTDRTVEDVLEELLRDRLYYGDEGGITISGGEPLCQGEFTAALLEACRGAGIHTAVETNLCFPWERVLAAIGGADLIMADLKDWDAERHAQYTGASNAPIIDNLTKLSAMGKPLILRTPIIPGVNDDTETAASIAAFAATLPSLLYYELLPYHPLGTDKARALGMEPAVFEKPGAEKMETLARQAASAGIPVRLAGKTITLKEEQS